MHIHKWGPWEDIERRETWNWSEGIRKVVDVPAQSRRCIKCNRRRVRDCY